MSADDIVTLLNELIRTSQDGRKGFAEAAEFAQDAQLKSLFILRSSECAQAVQELQAAVEMLGREAEEQGTAAGTAHRGWIRVKTSVEDNNKAVLEEVERGEDHAKTVYAQVLSTPLPPEIKTLVQKQYRGVLRNHEQIRSLRQQYQAAA
jgi:uncharacterized protein (TIGR02284 family)